MMTGTTVKTILIVDDHPIFRQGLKHILESLEWAKVIGEAENGDSAQVQIRLLQPDIVILDLAMPGKDGLSVLEETRKEYPDQIVIIITSYDDLAYLKQALRLGARAYVLKDSATGNLVQCLETVLAGDVFISPSFGNAPSLLPSSPSPDNKLLEGLTKTEKQILGMVAKYMTSKEIAKELSISYRTVQNHRTHICEKLSLKGAHQLMSFAQRNLEMLHRHQ